MRLGLWIVWISFPQKLWKSHFHQFFILGDVDNSPGQAMGRENALPGVEDEEGADVDEKRAGRFLAHGVIHKNCG